MEIVGYAASLVIGFSLGLFGGGGSILTVPVLVYLFQIDPVIASAYSLFIVGTTSLMGVFPKYRAGEVHLRSALLFGIPSLVAVFTTRALIVPAIPSVIGQIGGFTVTRSLLMMTLFATLMILASLSMIRGRRNEATGLSAQTGSFSYIILLAGLAEGTLTGLVGAGGGFLIIPALVLLGHLPMKQAVGTSLLIISVKSLIGFTGDLGHTPIHWNLLVAVTALAITGFFLGNGLGKKIAAAQLRRAFGWFILLMGIYILIRELVLNSGGSH